MAGVNYCFPILQPRTMTLMEERDVSERGYWAVIKNTGQVKPEPELGEVGAFYDHELNRLLEAVGRLQKLESDLAAMKLNSAQVEALPRTILRIEEGLEEKSKAMEELRNELARKEEEHKLKYDERRVKDEAHIAQVQALPRAILRIEEGLEEKSKAMEELRNELARKDEQHKLKDEELRVKDEAHKLDIKRRDLAVEDVARKCEQSVWILAQRWAQLQHACEQLSIRMAKLEATNQKLEATKQRQETDTQNSKEVTQAQQQIEMSHQQIQLARDQLAIKQEQQTWELESRLATLEYAELEAVTSKTAASSPLTSPGSSNARNTVDLELPRPALTPIPIFSSPCPLRIFSSDSEVSMPVADQPSSPSSYHAFVGGIDPPSHFLVPQNQQKVTEETSIRTTSADSLVRSHSSGESRISISSQILSTCVGCMSSLVSVRFLPCRHEILCLPCFRNLLSSTDVQRDDGSSVPCVMCRVPVDQIEEIPIDSNRLRPVAYPESSLSRRRADWPLRGGERDYVRELDPPGTAAAHAASTAPGGDGENSTHTSTFETAQPCSYCCWRRCGE